MGYINWENIKHRAWILAVGFNLMLYVILLLLFEPTAKCDDYGMLLILYGGFTGEYSPYMLFSNILLGRVIQGLMHLCPTVSWYYMLQHIGLIIAFSCITYVIIKKSNNRKWVFPCLMFLLFCGYECYIRITFTTTAGVLIAAGFLLILYRIESKETFGSGYFCGIGLILWGILIRRSMYELIAVIFVASFIIFLSDHNEMERGEIRKWCIYFITITVGIWIAGNALQAFNKWQMAQDAEWQDFLQTNTKRALVYDYGWPDYEKYREEYARLGVSANDLSMWKTYLNVNDMEVLSPELFEEIRAITPIDDHTPLVQTLDRASKSFLTYYFSDTSIYLFLLCALYLVLYQKQGRFLRIGIVSGCCIFAYYYMFCQGRLGQYVRTHHVDVAFWMAGASLLLYYSFPAREDQKAQKHLYAVTALLAVAFILKFYVGLSSSSYYGDRVGYIVSQKEQFSENKKLLSLLSEDEKHLYLFGSHETNRIYDAAWSVAEVMTPGFYHNLCLLNFYGVPDYDQVLENYGIKNAYREITNSNVIYFADTGYINGQMETVLQYIREHYCPGADSILVKKLDGLNIYRFTEGEIKPRWTAEEVKSGADFQADIRAVIEDGVLRVSGYAFLDGIDSYAQNIYLCTKESEKETAVYWCAVQMENEQFADQDKYHGKYSSFYGEYILEKNAKIEDLSLDLYLDTGDDVYYLPVTLQEK